MIQTRKIEQTKTVKLPFEGEVADRSAVVPVCVFGEESVFDLVVVAVCVFGEETTLPINRVPTGGTNGDGGEGDACFLGIHEQSDSKQTE